MTEIALIGKKIGMTREFYKTGQIVPVTVLKVEKARVIQVIDEEKRGYKAVQLGYGKIKNSIINWINEDDLKKYILTYQDAGFEHGGDGALFVYLRKKKV